MTSKTKPYLLRCGHTFCLTCIRSFPVRSTDEVACLVCSETCCTDDWECNELVGAAADELVESVSLCGGLIAFI